MQYVNLSTFAFNAWWYITNVVIENFISSERILKIS